MNLVTFLDSESCRLYEFLSCLKEEEYQCRRKGCRVQAVPFLELLARME